MIFREVRENAEAAVSASSKTALALSRLMKDMDRRLGVIEERLKALEDAFNDGEVKSLREQKDYIEGMFNILNYDPTTARKGKGRELNE